MKITTWRNYDPNDHRGSINDKPSLTVPNMAMSLKTLLERFTRGQSIPTNTPVYHEDEEGNVIDLPDIGRLNKLDRIDLLKETKAATIEHQKQMAIKKQKREAKQIKQQINDIKQNDSVQNTQ